MSKKLHLIHSMMLCGVLTFASSKAHAQLTPDNTLSSEASRVNQNVLIKGALGDSIDGGAQRGINLFHSFTDFNIKDGQRVYFVNPSGVTNILTRVTGSNASNILGTLGVDGAANLFLINPNGILFGKNASLDIGGSFVGTTANALQFGNQGIFSASVPQSAPLLTINPSAFLFNQINPGSIVNQSQAPAGINPAGSNTTGLRVPDGKSFVLVGGDINLDGGGIRAYSGRVELAGLVAPGSIGLNVAADVFSLNVGNNLQLADISLSNVGIVAVQGAGSGNIVVNARNLNMDNSSLYAGISGTKEQRNTTSGDITLNVTGAITATQTSGIDNQVYAESVGNAGNININTNSLSLLTGSEINTKTLGQGNAGSININASKSVTLDGFGETTLSTGDTGTLYSRIISSVNPEGIGKGGDINIKTPSLQLSNGAFISSSINGKGDAGNIIINATEVALSSGADIDNNVSGVGNGGDIRILTNTLSILDGSDISSYLFGQGNAGNIEVNARNSIKLDGNSLSGIQADTAQGSIGNGGNIQVTAGSLSITNGASIDTSAYGKGSAGNITVFARDTITIEGFDPVDKIPSWINSSAGISEPGNSGNIRITARELYLKNNGQILSNNLGRGDAGSIYIQASDKVSLSNANNIDYTEISNSVGNPDNSKNYGNGAAINIETGDLLLDNASINSYVIGKGSAGSININAKNTVTLTNKGYFSNSTSTGGVGNGGDININTKKLSLDNGSYFYADTYGQGNSGNISINASDSVFLTNNSSLSNGTSKEAVGNGGDININTTKLYLDNISILSTASYGQGNGGNILVKATDVSLFNKSFIASGLSETVVGNSGNIDIFTGDLSVVDSSSITSVNGGGKGNAGNIRINANDDVLLKNNSFITSANFGTGDAGNIFINAKNSVALTNKSYFGSQTMPLSVGNGGNINIRASKLSLDNNSYFFAATNAQGNSGNISVKTTDISLFNKSYIISGLGNTAVGNGGNIDILTGALSIENLSWIYSGNNGGKGNGGNIRINATDNISLKNASTISATAYGTGSAGNITVNSGGTVSLDSTGSDTLNTGIYSIVGSYAGNIGTGKGGNINLNARNLLMNRAQLSSSSFGSGNGGDINVNTARARLDNQSTIASVTNSGNGGNIKLNATDYLLLRRNSNVQTSAGQDNKSGGNGGNINIEAPFIIALPNEYSYIAADAFTGSGGNVRIGAQSVFGIEARPKPTGVTSEITASSRFGVQGTVGITQPEIQPTKTITSLPVQVVDATTKLSQMCPRDIASKPLGQFVITGRGSLPPSPLDPMPGMGTPTLASVGEGQVTQVQQITRASVSDTRIVEAQGFVKNNDGSIELVATAPNVRASATSTQASCPGVARGS